MRRHFVILQFHPLSSIPNLNCSKMIVFKIKKNSVPKIAFPGMIPSRYLNSQASNYLEAE